jgi:hypothetical protein
LEKRLRREKETQLRKQQLEAEMEHKKEETRYWVWPGGFHILALMVQGI